jgi:hypothetical protein
LCGHFANLCLFVPDYIADSGHRVAPPLEVANLHEAPARQSVH